RWGANSRPGASPANRPPRHPSLSSFGAAGARWPRTVILLVALGALTWAQGSVICETLPRQAAGRFDGVTLGRRFGRLRVRVPPAGGSGPDHPWRARSPPESRSVATGSGTVGAGPAHPGPVRRVARRPAPRRPRPFAGLRPSGDGRSLGAAAPNASTHRAGHR